MTGLVSRTNDVECALSSVSDDTHYLRVRLRQERPIPLDVELDCGRGELLALVGPSGSGKTTILRCIAGLHRAEQGFIACDGTTWLDTGHGINLPPQRRSVGFVPQHYALFPHLTAEANVRFALGRLPRSRRAVRANELFALVNLSGLEGRNPAELSGGQQQRVALARALARDPAVLLLDEPFSAVDQVTRRKMQRELAQLRERIRLPIILVTHDLDEAVSLANRMVVLHRGRSLQAGSPAEVMSRPRDAEVARLVDQQNLFQGEVIGRRSDSDRTLLRWLGYTLEARLAPAFPAGSQVDWLVPPCSVVLHRQHRSSRGDHWNSVRGTVAEMLVLGGTAEILVRVKGTVNCDAVDLLAFSVPTRTAMRYGVAVGKPITVSLLADDLHIMPPTTRQA
ncbi:ABC transporter ATP-binding protein [Bradyrhizobium sp. ISRA443]|uniref:ABC transporter ATP-binding protein n=1 Tax=Bradyrhizobium sp. ISRA443 TaxID=2866198 RepID=UPI00247ACE7F|nr:ABC transporter ATP-binding protein [Bradyrhizobium sp. ISRA443]WGS15852.1 ABC transporter ATP-binding protein [Bradyrhizobium sp. ISRA443]